MRKLPIDGELSFFAELIHNASIMNEQVWYADIIKPEWAPPGWLFGPVWSILYILIVITFGYVFYQAFITKNLSIWIAIPFLINLFFNLTFVYVQMGMNNLPLATVWIIVIWLTIVWGMAAVWNEYRWVAYLQIPYLLWVSFATVLQGTITWLNK